MKNKIYISISIFVIFIAILTTSSFAVSITEKKDNYKEGALIYGSTRFETDVVITAAKAYDAGVNEAKLNVALGKNLADIKPVVPYFYDGASWYQITESETEPAKPLTEEQVEKVESELNIFFVNNEVKKVEVEFEGNVDKTSLPSNVKYEDGKFIIPATTFNFTFTETKIVDGEEVVIANEVSTNIDKTVTSGKEEKPVIAEPSKNYVAKVGSEYFEDLALALTKATNENEVILIENVELTKGLEIKNTVTINLNGKTLSASKYMESLALIKVDGGNLTINGDGIVNSASQGNDYSMAVWVTGTGVATINGGIYTNVGAKSFEDNGTTPNNNELIYANGSGKVYINDGKFTGNTLNTTHGVKYTLNLKDNSEAKIEVKGGTFTKYNPANSESENPRMNFLADGYKLVEKQIENSSEFEYTVKLLEDTDVAIAKAVAYSSLEEAVENATSGDEIVLLKDIVLTNMLNIKKEITLNLNGKTIRESDDYSKNSLIVVWENGKLTLDGNGTIEVISEENDGIIAIWAYDGEVVINNGTYINLGTKSVDADGNSNNNELIYASRTGKITINGGTFIGNTENEEYGAKYTLNLRDQDKATAKIIVKGGTFAGYDPANSKSENPTANLVDDGYKSVKDGDTYKVLPYDAEKVTDEAELRALIAKGESVKLATNIEISETIIVNKVLTLDLNGYEIKNKTDIWNTQTGNWSLISVREGGNLTINGNGTLRARENDCYAIDVDYDGELTINNGTFIGNISAVYVYEGTATINGGDYSIQQKSEFDDYRYTLNCWDANYKTGDAKIIVNGGTFEEFNPANNLAEGPNTSFVPADAE